MSSKKKEEEVVPDATPDEHGRIPANAILYSLRKHQEGIKGETASRSELQRTLLLSSFPKWGTDEEEEGGKKDGH